MKRNELLKKVFDAKKYTNNFMAGLKCLGSFKSFGYVVELYELPGSYDFGMIDSSCLCQIHPYDWHKNRILEPAPRKPFNKRIIISRPNSIGAREIRLSPITMDRVVLKRKNIRKRKVKRKRIFK